MRKSTLLLLFLTLGCGSLQAAQLYQWTDDQGVTHFSDNPMDVPPGYRDEGARDVKPLRAVARGEAGGDAASEKPGMGASLWQQHCQACHSLDKKAAEGSNKTALGHLLIDAKTRFPATVEQLLPKLQRAAEGRWTDMPSVHVSRDELRQIASFMLEQN
jgi:mono/diheme cytochrome c family protein